ncbi:MAG: arylsulfatase [Bacteroidota bacterium]
MKYASLLFLLLILISCKAVQEAKGNKEKTDRPNIVLIMGDDIGYSDIASYGSEIKTPHLDRLAYGGLRFKQFYNMAKCNPTRSSLMTGLYKGDERAISFVSLLRDDGYFTAISGKEHFDRWVPQEVYFANTFSKSFTFWATTEYFVPPSGTFERPFYLQGEEIDAEEIEAEILPKYKTDFITDYGLRYLEEMLEKDDPFFLFLPYHVAHYPLQARPEDIAKYRGKYKKGWDKLRQERFTRMKEMGILEKESLLSPPEGNSNKFRGYPKHNSLEIRKKFPTYYPWDSISEEEQDKKDLEMAVFAAMIDRMDQNIGRVLDRLEKAGELENTLILFFTDNGSCPFDSNKDFSIPPGPANGYRCLSPVWANVGNTPFRLYKQNGHEGGTNTHFIAHWPKKIKAGQITDQVGHVVDLFPTFLEVAGISYPGKYEKKKTLPLHGSSLLPIFQGKIREEAEFFISGFTERFRMFRRGDWKIVKENGEDWELYNIREDRTELNDLAKERPEVVSALLQRYQAYQEEETRKLDGK